MVSGTLYTYPGSHRAYQILIAAAYSGSDVKLHSGFEFGKTNNSEEFLKKFPFGKVPAFEDSDGNCLTETAAIASYVCNDTLRGGSSQVNQALVQQFVSFAENEITPSACAWTFPTLGFRQYNKQETEKAMSHVKKCLQVLNDLLLTRTFIVGESVTLADITLCCSLLVLFLQVLDPDFRKPYGNVNRWFTTCINQPNFKTVLGEIKLCSKMAQFDSKRYTELHPKQDSKKGKQGKQDGKKAEKTVKAEKAGEIEATQDELDSSPAEKPSKKDFFADVPKSSFVMDDWKRKYANNPVTVSYPWLWENFDSNAYSFWRFTYLFPLENKRSFNAGNLLGGFIQRVEDLRKHSHMIGAVYEVEVAEEKDGVTTNKTCYAIEGCWLFKGTSLIFERNPDWDVDYPSYKWSKLDLTKQEDRDFIEYSFSLDEDNYKGKRINGKYMTFKELR